MANIWERFDDIVSTEEVAEAKEQFAPTPAGIYDAVLTKYIASESQNGLPMIKGSFKLVNGKNVFFNILLQNVNYPENTKRNVAQAHLMTNQLTGFDADFEGLGNLAGRIDAMSDAEGDLLDEYKKPHRIKVSYGKKDLDMKFANVDVLSDPVMTVFDEDTPF